MQHLEAKWRWAGHVARLASYRANSWALKAMTWMDAEWRRASEDSNVVRARPDRWRRWEDEISKFTSLYAIDPWVLLALDKNNWQELTAALLQHCRK